MTFTTEITGMTFFRGSVGKSGVHRLALAEVHIPEMGMHINGVQLTWTPNKGYAAQSPSAMIHGAIYAVTWALKSDFACDLAQKMVKLYEAMGGKLPSDETAAAITNAGDPGKPKTVEADRNRANGARRIAERASREDHEIERRVVPFKIHSVDGKPIDEWNADVERELDRMDDGKDDASGLHAFLGVDAVSEAMDRAGL